MLELSDEAEVARFLRRANDRYLHWDKLRHYPFPDGLDAESAWYHVRVSRQTQFQSIPITFNRGSQLRYWTPPQHQQWLHEIDKDAGGSIGVTSGHGSDSDRHLINSLMEEAIASSQLEGASTTRSRAKEMLRANRKPIDTSERMIRNNYRTILHIRDELREKRLTPNRILEIQAMVTEGTLKDSSAEGRFRTEDDDVVVEDRVTQETLYTPPPAPVIPDRLKEICSFANTDSKPFVHPVIKAIALHFAIGFVHPFADGNGRTARALFYWYMLKQGYWLFEYLPISRIFLAAPARYTRAYLYTETDGGDLTYFIHYHLGVVVRAIGELHEYLARQQKKVREIAGLLRNHPSLNHRQIALLQHAIKNPGYVYTIRQHQGSHNITYRTARSDLLGLVEMQLLARMKREGRQIYFTPSVNLAKRLMRSASHNREE